MSQEFHILPNYDDKSHDMTPECWCKPTRRSKEDAGNAVCWQHNISDPRGGQHAPPFMCGGLMDARGWTLYAVKVDEVR